MDYTISNVLEIIRNWYLEFEPEEQTEDFDDIEEKEESEEITYDLEAAEHVQEKIMELSTFHYDDYINLITLLTLDYYNILSSGEYESNEDDDVILELIENIDKYNLLSCIESGETTFLDNIISLILEHYEFGNYANVLNFSYYNYSNMDRVFKSPLGRKIYKEFHPNILEELNNLNEYKKQIKLENSTYEIKINSLFEYIYYLLVYKQIIKNKFVLVDIFVDRLMELEEENNKLYMKIINYIIGYFYLVTDKKEKNNIELNEVQLENLNWLKNNNINNIYERTEIHFLVKEFINYDLIEYDNLLNESNGEVKQMVKKLSDKNK